MRTRRPWAGVYTRPETGGFDVPSNPTRQTRGKSQPVWITSVLPICFVVDCFTTIRAAEPDPIERPVPIYFFFRSFSSVSSERAKKEVGNGPSHTAVSSCTEGHNCTVTNLNLFSAA